MLIPFAGLICAWGLACGATEPRDPLAIVFSGSANGILSSCHCPNSPWGGLAKRAWLIDQLRDAAGKDNLLALDSGDLFPVDPAPGRSALLLKLMGLMDYQAVGIGDQDLAEGLDAWMNVQREAGYWNEASGRSTFPWLSGGYRLAAGPRQRQMLVPPWTVWERAGLRIGIVSVVGTEAWRFARSKPEGLELMAPDWIVAAFLDQTRDQRDLAIVLSHQGLDADRLLASKTKGIDLIIGGHSQSLVSPPEIVNGVAICQTGKNGENLGVLALSLNTDQDSGEALPIHPPAETSAAEGKGNDPFQPTAVQTPRWRIVQQMVPLTTAIEDSEAAGKLIGAYYAEPDARNAERLSTPDPGAKPEDPQLVLHLPSPPLVLTAGERQTVSIRISNTGGATLIVERIRSKSPWMTVLKTPARIESGSEDEATFEVIADNIDRFFRCEFSVWANDPRRRVVLGAFHGRVEGPMPGILDAKTLWSTLAQLAAECFPERTTSPAATVESPMASRSGDLEPANDIPPAMPPAEVNGSIAANHPPALAPQVNPAPAPVVPARRVLVEFFFAPGCWNCKEVEHRVLPAFFARFGDAVDFRKLDVTAPANYLRLANLQDRLNIRANESVSIYVDETTAVLGYDAIQTDLENIVAGRLATAPSMDSPQSAEGLAAPAFPLESVPPVLTDRLRAFTLPAVLVAGFVDGINPCAFATIVFFITLLGISGVAGWRLLPVAAGYAMAVFGTYLLMGLGAFRMLQVLHGWILLATVLRWVLLGALVLLALFSFRDAWQFHRTGNATGIVLQLPDCLKRRMHGTMRKRLNPANLFFSALVIGVLATLIEAVCTGQVYLPTLVLLSRYAETRMRAFPLLMIYNLMFILPLLVVIAAAFFGTRNPRLIEWSKHNVVWGKVAMGTLFVCLAAVLILT